MQFFFLLFIYIHKKGDSVAEDDGTQSIHACIQKLRPPSPEIELDRLSQQFQRGITGIYGLLAFPHWLRRFLPLLS